MLPACWTNHFLNHPTRTTRWARGFTLIELLVVIATVGVLIGILVPALSIARNSAKTVRELAAGQQLMVAYGLYADDNKAELLPGYPPDSWVSLTPAPGSPSLTVYDDANQRVTGPEARRYPWRMIPFLDNTFAALYKDEKILKGYRDLGKAEYHYLVSLSPSFGLNSTFVGGDSDRLGWNKAAQSVYGPFAITRLDQTLFPTKLISFASGRGPGIDGDATEGFFRIDAPSLRVRQWSVTPTWNDPGALPASYGNVSYRHAGRSVVMTMDSHAELLKYAALDDMRRWANTATAPDWNIAVPLR